MTPLPRQLRFHLRPSLGGEHFAREAAAMYQIAGAAAIDEVAIFVPHNEARSPGLGTIAETEACLARLAPVVARLRELQITPSLNLYWICAFSDFPGAPRDLHDRFEFAWAVNANGRISRNVACPQCVRWRNHINQMCAIFARLKPANIWLDDDVRATLRGDMRSCCCCDRCLAALAERAGSQINRADVVPAIVAEPPNPIRDAWLDLQSDLFTDIVSGMAAAVHAVSPQTRLSLMFSPVEGHHAEGRSWARHYAALGQPTPMARPHIGCYQEGTANTIATGFTHTQLSQAVTPLEVKLAPEIENHPHSRFSKSIRLTLAQMTYPMLLGMSELTFSLYRFAGRLDLERNDVWPDVLRNAKPRLQAICDLQIQRDQLRGIALHWHEAVCRHAAGTAQADALRAMQRQRPFDAALPLLGFATTMGTGPLTVFSAETICCLSDAELQQIFTGGVLLDARAAQALIRRGYGGLAGLSTRLDDVPAALEVCTDAAFGGIADEPLTIRHTGAAWQFQTSAATHPISMLVDYQGVPIGHGLLTTENALGGRVGVLPYDSQVSGGILSGSFLNAARQAQLHDLLVWLQRGPLPLFVPEAPSCFPVCIEQDRQIIVGVINLLPDPIDKLRFHLGIADHRQVAKVEALDAQGRWQPVNATVTAGADAAAVQVKTDLRVDYLQCAVLRCRPC